MLIFNVFTYESGRKNFLDFQIQIFSRFFSGLIIDAPFSLLRIEDHNDESSYSTI